MRQARAVGRLNRTQLGEAVAIELDISHADGARVIDAVFDVIVRTAAAGHTVNITNVGTWTPVQTAERTARNPQNGAAVPIPARQDIRFRIAPRFRDVVHAADPATATVRKHPKSPR